MKRILFIIAFCSPLLAQAQSIEHILKSIEQNNKELKAQKHAADATTVLFTVMVPKGGTVRNLSLHKVLISLLSILSAIGRLLCRTKRWTSNNRLPA
ncbi:MAG TPA: hypothetical protein PK290_08975, partial [Bacteroides uniformis]|nr:hypothetical protein [Bacteroides uniformis]